MKCPNCGNETDSGKELCFFCGHRLPIAIAQQPAQNYFLVPGTLLKGRYEINNERPREHGMGIVYFAIDRQVENKPCVVKQVKEMVTSDKVLENLEGEARRMANLSQSIGGRLPEILEAFVENKMFFVIQQRIPGKDLDDVYEERKPLKEAEVVNWAIQCCRVLQLIHNSNQLHRDISPDNLMLTPAGDIVFIDFGTLRELKRIVQGTVGMGKYGFTPYEQWVGKPCRESDIFALGATIYKLLTGFLPPLSDQVKRRGPPLRSDWEPVFPPIRKNNPNVSAGLESILVRALKPSISERYHSADELRNDLEKLHNLVDTVKCPRCGHENNASYTYCEKCQTQLYSGTRPCPRNPKHKVPVNAKFCPKCGARMP